MVPSYKSVGGWNKKNA